MICLGVKPDSSLIVLNLISSSNFPNLPQIQNLLSVLCHFHPGTLEKFQTQHMCLYRVYGGLILSCEYEIFRGLRINLVFNIENLCLATFQLTILPHFRSIFLDTFGSQSFPAHPPLLSPSRRYHIEEIENILADEIITTTNKGYNDTYLLAWIAQVRLHLLKTGEIMQLSLNLFDDYFFCHPLKANVS